MHVKNPKRYQSWQPTVRTIEQEREHRQQVLAAAFRIFGKFGFSEGVAGHITARDPEHSDQFWLNPFGVSFNQISVSDLILCNSQGVVLKGESYQLNRAAFAIHSTIHAARPDVVAIAHTHSLYGKTWSCLGRLLDPISQDSCAFYQDHVLYDDYKGIVLSLDEGQYIAKILGDHKAAILKNHGLLTVADSVEAAAWWFISMERCCQAQLLAHSTQLPMININPDIAIRIRDNAVGFPLSGYFNFQPLWQDITKQFPDLFN